MTYYAARTDILGRLEDKVDYYRYLDSLLGLYLEYNLRRKELSPDLADGELVVFGGIVYFLLFREASECNLLDDLDEELCSQFWKYKTVDIDIQCLFSDWYEDDPTDFVREAMRVRVASEKILIEIDSVHPEYLDAIVSIVNPIESDGLTFARENRIGLNFMVGDRAVNSETEEFKSTEFQCRQQLTVNLGENLPEEHVFECLFLARFEAIKTVTFNFSTAPAAFVGENLINSLTEQIYPTKRAWTLVDTLNLTAEETYEKMAGIFKRNPLAEIKFRQGYERVRMLRFIYERAVTRGVDRIAASITPSTNRPLVTKLFFFRSKSMRTLCSARLVERGQKLYSDLIEEGRDEPASPENTLTFMDLCLEAWREFDARIKMY